MKTMKTMKKTILILTVVFTAFLSSCKKDEETTPTQDPVIGTWKLDRRTSGGVESNLNDCEKTSTAAFTEDTVTFTWYSEETVGGNTSCNQSDITNFTWENLGNSNYKFTESSTNEITNTIITFGQNTIIIDVSDEEVVLTYSKQ